ncbi:MAG: hypothetical protein WC741_01750 [Patescibacteria group bacterium]|jgi:hypothetical protein
MDDGKFDLNINDQDGFRKFIEYEAASIIIDLLEKGTIDEEKAGRLSQLTLDLIVPGMTVEELYLSGVKLDDHNPELAPVVYKIMKIYEEKFEKKALAQVSSMVKNKQFGQAQDLVKKVLQFKMNN